MNKTSKDNLIPVLFENDNIIAFDKPSGLLVIPDQHTPIEKTLLGYAEKKTDQKLWIVHRIDRGTSGIVLFAKNAPAHANVSRQFEKGQIKKVYLALLNGNINEDSGRIDAPISVDGRTVGLDKSGKPSVTEFEVVERFRDYTLVHAYPGTGRRHQIRLHFLSLGTPLAVDDEYSGRHSILLSEFKKKYKETGVEKPLISRLTLHAQKLTLTEPSSNESLSIESAIPKDFEITLKQLRKYNKY